MEATYTIGLTEAKMRFNALAEQVNRTGTAVTVYKRNKPFVTIAPAAAAPVPGGETEVPAGAPAYRDAADLLEDLGA